MFKKLFLFFSLIAFLFIGLVGSAVYIVSSQQDKIVQEVLTHFNQDFKGSLTLKGSHIELFSNFPYISVDLEELSIYEYKETTPQNRILFVQDANIGFDLWDILNGNYLVKAVKLKDGQIRLVQHTDGEFNIARALQSDKPVDSLAEEFHLDIRSIELESVDISKLNEENNILLDIWITKANSTYKTTDKSLEVSLDSKFEFSLIKDGDTTFLKHKHFELSTALNIDKKSNLLTILPTEILLEGASFNFAGNILLTEAMPVDLRISGNKPDFNLFMALVPDNLAESLKQFDNKGKIYFDVEVKGNTGKGENPYITAAFGCEKGYFDNQDTGKKLDEIGFRGIFTNGRLRKPETMYFELENFSAKPEAGVFSGRLSVRNFLSPEIDMRLVSDFDLDFLSRFLNTKELKGLSGRVKLTMNFRDIIDLEHPERSIERLNESYASELDIQNLKFSSEYFHLPLENLDLKMHSAGHEAVIDYVKMKVGNSDLTISGKISDLPAILHHTDIPVQTDLIITSTLLDLEELTQSKSKKNGLHEQINNLKLITRLDCSARSITESPNLPTGIFHIQKLTAGFKQYPHKLHDWHARIQIDTNNLKIEDFSGMLDQSDFHLNARIQNYALWFQDKKQGDTKVDMDITSNLIQFHDLFSYKGENYFPEEYRHEEIKGFHFHAGADLHFKDSLYSTDAVITALEGKFKMHPLKLEQFSGKIKITPELFSVQQLSGKMGHSDLKLSMQYHLTNNSEKNPHNLSLISNQLDLNELLNYTASTTQTENATVTTHDSVVSLYDFKFPNMNFHLDIKKFNYANYALQNLKAGVRMQSNHMIHFDTCQMDIAGGHVNLSGYFSGKDKLNIYFNPVIKMQQVDLDKIMLKFDNFGQDHMVSENLHGKISGTIKGKIHLHADFIPKIDDSDLTIEMLVDHGRLDNYGPMLALKDYFQENKLKSVTFDTLRNTFILKRGVLEIPLMTIQSNLGFMEISGKQKIEDKLDMDYKVGMPWKLMSQAAKYKLFGNKENSDTTGNSDIIRREDNARMLYLRISGDPDNYKMSLASKGVKAGQK
jgi:uncharacterized protein involved in outer membrane biogenesis